jgi:serine/threonine-protein kinase
MSDRGGNGAEYAQTAARMAPQDPLLGVVVDGRYRFEAVLGEGGMGIVYKATHTALGKPLAVKVLKPEVSKNEQIVARFKQEAQSASAIGNQHIIDVSDFGVMPDGSTYFVMEFLTGQSLTEALEQNRFATERTLRVGKQLCNALGAAHEIGVVHRDLKPDNVQLVTRGGQQDFVKVLDFGIAKVGGSTSKLTQAGQVFGTPHYMSPEQCAGTAVDHRTDIYAVGVILYEMATGQVPFDADNLMGILTKHLYENPVPPHELPPPVDVPPALEAVILKCLAKKPETRYQSMGELLADLEAVEGGLTPKAVADHMAMSALGPHTDPDVAGGHVTVGMGQPIPGKRGALPLVVGAVVLLAGGAAAFLLVGGQGGTAPADEHLVQPAPVEPAPPAPPAPSVPAPTAPPPAPAPVPPPTAVKMVQVTIHSDPVGAELYRGGALLGNTPVSLPRPDGSEAVELELRAKGYAPKPFSITSQTGETLNVALAKVATPRVHKAAPRPAPVQEPAAPKGKPQKQRRVQTEVLDPWD